MNVLVIIEKDYQFQEEDVIGVADSVENAKKIVNEYYGEHRVIMHNADFEYPVHYSDLIEVGDTDSPDKFRVTLIWFKLNEI